MPVPLAHEIYRRTYELYDAQHQAALDARHFRHVAELLRRELGGLAGLRLLDLGHGSRFNQLLLFHSLGVLQIVGVDMDRYPLRPTSLWALARRTVYYLALQARARVRLRFAGLQVVQGDALQLPLADGCLDGVISNAVFEHLPDAGRAVAEIRRTLRPGGVAYIGAHVWTSPSGSHHPAIVQFPLSARRWPRGLAPWFHLRGLPPFDERQAPTYGYQQQYLNRLGLAGYRAAFEASLEIRDWRIFYQEGADLLSADLRAELASYSVEDLTARSLRVLARRAR